MAERVKSIRFALGVSQVALAEKLHVAFSTSNRWERGKTRPLPALVRLLEAPTLEAGGSLAKKMGGNSIADLARGLSHWASIELEKISNGNCIRQRAAC